MAIKKSELYSSLWAGCDELRGSMDASQYKDYVLVLLFLKYVSDKGGALVDIPEGASFKDMVKLKGKTDIGDKINKIIGELAKANDLTGIITEADFNNDDKLGSGKEKIERLSNLIEIFENPELDFSSNRAEGDDILGDAYEYLMRHFATESGKSKGQFYTPAEVSRVMAKVIGITNSKSQSETIYDPTCGSGSLLLKAADEAPNGITIYGQEKDKSNRALAVMNMWLHGNPASDIRQGNTMSSPQFTNEDTGELKQFDYAVANPPFSYKAWTTGWNPADDIYKRFDGYDALPPKKNGDFAFLLHLIKSLKSKGKACIVLPLGVLFRGNAEADIRKKIIDKGYIKGIIGLPTNLFYGTTIAACLIVIDKEDAGNRKDIFMIDAGKGFIKDGNKNRLREQDIRKIVDTFNNRIEISKYSRLIPISEITDPRNDCNLNIPRYIDNLDVEDLQDIEAHLLGDIPNCDIDDLGKYWEVYPTLRSTLFTASKRANYSALCIANEEIKNTIFHHPEFTTFSKQMDAVFEQWETETTAYAKLLDKGLHPKQEIYNISENLLNAYENKNLIDKYDVYQHLMNYWAETMQDDMYELAADGWDAGNGIKRIEKITKKGDKEIMKPVAGIEGLEGRLIPPALIIQEYFATEQKTIDDLKAELERTSSEKDELSEENGSEGQCLHDVSNKTEVNKAIEESNLLAWEEYFADTHKAYSAKSLMLIQLESSLSEKSAHDFFNTVKNVKGKITQKAVNARLKSITDTNEIRVLQEYIELTKKIRVVKKEMSVLYNAAIVKIKEKMESETNAEYLSDLSILNRFLHLLEKETQLRAEIKVLYEDLEALVINKYPTLSIDEIKTILVEKKWVHSMEQRIQTEMDNVSHRLTQRIKELAERYETPLPQLSNEVNDLTAKVENHLKEMNFVW